MIMMLPENKGKMKLLNYCVTKDPGETKLRVEKWLYIRMFLIKINTRGEKTEKRPDRNGAKGKQIVLTRWETTIEMPTASRRSSTVNSRKYKVIGKENIFFS